MQIYMLRVLIPSSGALTTVITVSGTGQLSLNSRTRANGSGLRWPMPGTVVTNERDSGDGCQHPKHVDLSTEV